VTTSTIGTFTRARIAMGSGDLFDVTNFTADIKSPAKAIHTLRQDVAGIFKGPVEASISFDAPVSDLGLEADWLRAVGKRSQKQLRVKIPNKTLTFTGEFESLGIKGSSDSETTVSLSFIGRVDV